MNDDAATALAAALDTIGANGTAADIGRLRKALALRGYTCVPIPAKPTAVQRVGDGTERVRRYDPPPPARDLTLLDGMCVDQLLDGVARLADAGARESGCRFSAGEAALVHKAMTARRGCSEPRAIPNERWARATLAISTGHAARWSPEECEAVRRVLYTNGYPREGVG